jgi:hypothetical protein
MSSYYHSALLLNNSYVMPDEIPVTMGEPPATVKTQGEGGRGLSTNVDPTKVEKYGGAYEIKMLPPELKAFQYGGDMGHFELGPVEKGLTLEEVMQFLRAIIIEGPKE